MAGNSRKTLGASAPFPLSVLKAQLDYDPLTGIFRWKVSQKRNQVKAGDVAGSLMKVGYIEIGIENHRTTAHRLAWYYITGEWPARVDHRNRIKTDNRWLNLRKATASQNQANIETRKDNTSGYKGVVLDSRRGTWTAEVRFEKKRHRKSGFASADAANEWAQKKRAEIHGEFATE